MSSIINKPKFIVTVKRRPDLNCPKGAHRSPREQRFSPFTVDAAIHPIFAYRGAALCVPAIFNRVLFP